MILFLNKLENLNKVDAFDIKICYAEKKKMFGHTKRLEGY